MAKNKIEDLRDHLFAQLERLSDDDEMKDPTSRETEIARAGAIVDVSRAIIDSAKVEVDLAKIIAYNGKTDLPTMFLNQPKQLNGGDN